MHLNCTENNVMYAKVVIRKSIRSGSLTLDQRSQLKFSFLRIEAPIKLGDRVTIHNGQGPYEVTSSDGHRFGLGGGVAIWAASDLTIVKEVCAWAFS